MCYQCVMNVLVKKLGVQYSIIRGMQDEVDERYYVLLCRISCIEYNKIIFH